MRCSNCDGELPIFGARCPKCRTTQRTVTLGAIIGLVVIGLLTAGTSPTVDLLIVLVGLGFGGKFVFDSLRKTPAKLTSYETDERPSFPGGPQQVIEIPIPPFEEGGATTSGKIRVTWNVTDAQTVSVHDGTSTVERLEQLQEMRNRGLITPKEFTEKRAQILKGL